MRWSWYLFPQEGTKPTQVEISRGPVVTKIISGTIPTEGCALDFAVALEALAGGAIRVSPIQTGNNQILA